MSYIIVIPARLHSTRLPKKVLLDLAGRPMIEHVWRRACASQATRVVVATDDQAIETTVKGFGGECVLTRSDHASGSDRIAEVIELLGLDDGEIVVNLQGDEPEMPPECLDQVARLLERDGPGSDGDVATLFRSIDTAQDAIDPNVVKVVSTAQGHALYFSRAPIPFVRGASSVDAALANGASYHRHIGLYAYRAGALRRFTTAAPSPLEQAESLEQLRFLELGMKICVEKAQAPIPAGIDSEADLVRARQRMKSPGG